MTLSELSAGHYSLAAKKIFTQWNVKVVLPADTTFVQINRAKRKFIILKHTSRFEIRHFRCRPRSRPPFTNILLKIMHFLFARTEKQDRISTYVLDIL